MHIDFPYIFLLQYSDLRPVPVNIAFPCIFLFVMTRSLVVRVPPVELDFYNRNTKELASSELFGLERKKNSNDSRLRL